MAIPCHDLASVLHVPTARLPMLWACVAGWGPVLYPLRYKTVHYGSIALVAVLCARARWMPGYDWRVVNRRAAFLNWQRSIAYCSRFPDLEKRWRKNEYVVMSCSALVVIRVGGKTIWWPPTRRALPFIHSLNDNSAIHSRVWFDVLP